MIPKCEITIIIAVSSHDRRERRASVGYSHDDQSDLI